MVMWCVFEIEHLLTGVEIVQNIDIEHVQLRGDLLPNILGRDSVRQDGRVPAHQEDR